MLQLLKNLTLIIILGISSQTYARHVEPILASITNHDFKQLRSDLAYQPISLQEKIQILEHAHATAQPHREKESTRQSVFSTLCVAFFGLGLCLFEESCRSYSFGTLDTRALLATLGCIGAGVACGYECEAGYYTTRALYIEKYLNNLFNVQSKTVVTIHDSLGQREHLIFSLEA